MTLRTEGGQLVQVDREGRKTLAGEIRDFKIEIDGSGSALLSYPFPSRVVEFVVDIDARTFHALIRDRAWESLRRQAMGKGRGRGWKQRHVRDRAKRGSR